MTREIKFRAWHLGAKQMLTNRHQGYEGNVFSWKHEGQPIIIMQYTGLKDKNANEIYDGDILQLHGDPSLRFPVKWEDEAAGWAIECHKSEPEFLGDYQPEYLEIIGNIHENSEIVA